MSTPKNPQEELYKSILMRHWRNPSFRRTALPEGKGFAGHEVSRTCGDRISMWLDREGDVIREVCFGGEGCSISVASANIASAWLQGQSSVQGNQQVRQVLAWLAALERGQEVPNPLPECEDLVCLESLAKYPTRVACARLAWEALGKLLA